MSQYVKDLFSWFVPDQYKTQEMWNREVQRDPWRLKQVPDQYKTQEMCNETVQRVPRVLKFVPDQFVTQEMCNEAVQSNPWVLKLVPDQFVTQEMWHEYFDDVPITWHDVYIKHKIQRAKIKEELMTVARHPDRW